MKKKLFNNIGLKIWALIAAVIIWALVVSINDPVAQKTYRNIKLNIANAEVITDAGNTYKVEEGDEISVTVKAQRSVLSQIEEEDIVATADMQDLTLTDMIPIEVLIPDYKGQYQEAVANPLNARVTIEETVSDKFPITVSTSGTPRDGYALAGTVVDPQTVTVTGPKSLIRSIDRAVVKVKLDGISSDTSQKVNLLLFDTDGKKIDQSRLSNNIGRDGIVVELAVDPTREIPVRVDKKSIRPAKGYCLLDVTVEPETVCLAAGQGELDKIEAITIPAEAFGQLKEEGEIQQTVSLSRYLPSGSHLLNEDETVTVTFELAKIEEKTVDYPTASIEVCNLSDELTLSYGDLKEIKIKVKGPKKQLSGLDLTGNVRVDLSSYKTEGKHTVPLKIDLPEDLYSEQHTVEIQLKQK